MILRQEARVARWLILIGIFMWFVLGEPVRDTATLVWPHNAAPWEEVDAFYYPNRKDPKRNLSKSYLANVDECRTWTYQQAALNRDPSFTRADYKCGVGLSEIFGRGDRNYRIIVK